MTAKTPTAQRLRSHSIEERRTRAAIAQRRGFGRALARVLVPPVASISFFLGLSGCGHAHGSARDPERQSDAEYDLAIELFNKGQARAALDRVRHSIELNEDNARAHYLASLVFLDFCMQSMTSPDCRLAEAERYARAAIKADDRFRDARNTLGVVLTLEQKFKEAIEVLTPLANDPAYTSSHLAWGNLGWAQVQAGQLDEGIASLRNAVTQPRFCVGHYRLGVAYLKKRDLARAEASFTSALSVPETECQNLQDAWRDRARVRLELGKPAEARIDLEKCRELSAESPTGKSCTLLLAAQGHVHAHAPQPLAPPQPKSP